MTISSVIRYQHINQINTFVIMPQQLPIKGLIRLNIIVSLLFSALLTMFLLALNYERDDVIYRFCQSFIFTNMISYGNAWLLFAVNLKFWNKRQKLRTFSIYLCSYIWGIVAWVLVVSLYSIVTGKEWEGKSGALTAYILATLAVFCFNTIILIIQHAFVFQFRNAQNEIEKLQLKANVSDTMNLLLRQQIQPHFLFNALATVKSLYKIDSKLGEQYLVHLANFLRVSVSNPKEHIALVKDEIAFCMNYLQMQKIRFGNAVEYDIKLDQNVLNKGYLPYFSLQPLIENALKHNDLTEERPLKISIYEENGFIIIRNNLQENQHKEESAGNGLFNLKERYQLLGEDEIRITSDAYFFTVYLKILMK